MTVTDITTHRTTNASHAPSRADKTLLGATWLPTDTAPEDGATILGRYEHTEYEIRWARNRPGNTGHGWVTALDGEYIDPPQCWRPVVTLHTLTDDCTCEPFIGDASTRWHRGDPANRVFVPVDGDDIDADGFPTRDHR